MSNYAAWVRCKVEARSKAGMNIDPAMLRQSAAMMKNMSPDQLKNMTEMAQKMHASGQLPKMPGMAGGFSPSSSANLSQSPVREER